MLTPGTILEGRYRIEGILGQGGMGTVYFARQVNLGDRAVAVKEMLSDHPGAWQQFREEAAALASLRHPSLVAVYDFFQLGPQLYFVMEYVEGRTLQQLLETTAEGCPPATAVHWGLQLCDVLEYLHGRTPPIIFRDLKPANVMLDSTGTLRLIDFGISHRLAPQQGTATFIRGAGTPGFAPPEQYGTGTDARSDVYALGATLYALLTRHNPPQSVDLMTGHAVLPPPSAFNPAVGGGLEMVVLKMMSLNVADRYPSAAHARAAMQEAATAPPGGAATIPPGGGKRAGKSTRKTTRAPKDPAAGFPPPPPPAERAGAGLSPPPTERAGAGFPPPPTERAGAGFPPPPTERADPGSARRPDAGSVPPGRDQKLVPPTPGRAEPPTVEASTGGCGSVLAGMVMIIFLALCGYGLATKWQLLKKPSPSPVAVRPTPTPTLASSHEFVVVLADGLDEGAEESLRKQAEQRKLITQGFRAEAYPKAGMRGTWFEVAVVNERVRWPSRAEAEAAANTVRAAGFSPRVIELWP